MISVNDNKIPFFSVIVCTYQRAELFPRAIESLLLQTEKDFEVLIVDDGSTDNTKEIADNYCKKFPNFRYLYHSHRGVALTKNAGILAASGLFVTFLDSDDEYDTEHLAFRKKILLQNNDVDLLHGGIRIIGDEFVPDKNMPGNLISIYDCIVGGTFVFRAELAYALGGFRDVFSEDSDFHDRVHNSGAMIAKTGIETYIYHRDEPDSICNNLAKVGA